MFETGVEKARAALLKLTGARIELETKTGAAQQELAALRESAGERELAEILEGADAGPARARIVELDARINGLAAARVTLLARIAGAQQAVQSAKAEAVRVEAAKMQQKLTQH